MHKPLDMTGGITKKPYSPSSLCKLVEEEDEDKGEDKDENENVTIKDKGAEDVNEY